MLISGNVSDQDLIDLLKLINSMSYTGVLLITSDIGNTSVVFDKGAITGACTAKENDYISELASLKTGRYLFKEQEVHGLDCDHKVGLATDVLFFEIAKRREENVESHLYEDIMVFELKPTPYFDILSFSSEEWRVIAMLSERMSVSQLKSKLNMQNEILTKILYTLEQSGVIKRVRAKMKETVKESVLSKLKGFISRILT
ncbi:MAG TPA: DUF4388 domain-containing protein [Caldisericia bacterium]|nr:DUF4388 domain-containing protein [Caldisericia bacterium]HPF48351.1 DUF4388 domain-containing protein [Caldisericia bacterium]HPI83470.1 DUF4388 domain-containing protein [Caldisericia bacterium]HPQ92804.1 DUF4388 domain-containing protein [Caldisericia bacterium]HRV74098.1 DUF4388 domain-containing protein [Caldisericia bacterium]